MLVAAALFGAVMVIFKKISKSHSNLEIVFYHNFACALLFIPFLFVNRPNPTLNQSLIAISYALTVGIISFILHYYSLKHLKTSTASFISYLEVVSGILFGIFLLNETLTYNTIIGGALIIGSTCLLKIKIID
jgi:drug/metabolite transporter (DMT)-like permease